MILFDHWKMLEYINLPYLFPSNVCYYFLRIQLIQTFAICDASFSDDQSSNKLSRYGTKVGTVSSTYNTGYIQITGSSGWSALSPIEINSANDWSMECEIKSNSNLLNGVLLVKDSTNFISDALYTAMSNGYGSYDYPYSSGKPFLFQDKDINYTANTWNKFKLELKSNTLYYYLYDSNGSLLKSKTVTLPSRYENSNLYFCPLVYEGTAQFKNVLIKPL